MTRPGARADGVRLALTTLTVLPVRGPAVVDRHAAATAMALAPAVGLLLAVPAALLLAGTRELVVYNTPELLAPVAAVALLALLTRGLHLDGLVDTADGLASYRDPEGTRAVMRSPAAGPLGTAVLLFTVLAQVTALHACAFAGRGTASLGLAVVTGRVAVALACTPRYPAASREGLGALVAGTVPRALPWVWAALAGVTAAAYEAVDESRSTTGALVVACARPLLAVAAALLVVRLVLRHVVRRVGGVTGDVLGLVLEVATTVVLVVMAFDLPEELQRATGWSSRD